MTDLRSIPIGQQLFALLISISLTHVSLAGEATSFKTSRPAGSVGSQGQNSASLFATAGANAVENGPEGESEGDDDDDDETDEVSAADKIASPAAAASATEDDEDSDEDELISGNLTLTSDYILRGLSQTDHKPAVQGGFDFEHPWGVYLGIWGSNVHFQESDAALELDVSGGYTYSFSDDFVASLGVLYYLYFGDESRNNWDVPLRAEWKAFSAEVDFSPHWAGDGNAWYLTVGWNDEIAWGFRLGLGVGYSIFANPQPGVASPTHDSLSEEPSGDDEIEEFSAQTVSSTPAEESESLVHSPNYFDFRLSVSHEFLDLDWELAGTFINHAQEINGTPGSARIVFSVSKSF